MSLLEATSSDPEVLVQLLLELKKTLLGCLVHMLVLGVEPM